MIISDNTQTITNNTGLTQRGFAIKANAKAFDLLFNSLYSDPLGAMIREVAANCADSHIAAGCPDKPITVHLPNILEPHFVFKDEGLGMTDDVISRVYTTVFESTKDDSNTQTGGFGLGCKTPYALGDNFTVVTIKDGIRNEYLMFRDEQRNPAYLQTSSTKTDEPNGTTVTVPYNKSHGTFDAIRHKAIDILSKFACPIKTNFEGLKSYREGLVRINDSISYNPSYNNGLFFVMANICYPVDLYDCGMSSGVFGRTIYVEIDNGSVDLTPSREHMQYTNRTIEFVKQKVSETKETVKEWIAESYKGTWEQRYEAYTTYGTLLRQRDESGFKHIQLIVPKTGVIKDASYFRDFEPGSCICDKKESVTFIIDDVTDESKGVEIKPALKKARMYLNAVDGMHIYHRSVFVVDKEETVESISAEAYDGDKKHLPRILMSRIVEVAEKERLEELDRKRAERKQKYATGGILACTGIGDKVVEISASDLTEKHLFIEVKETVDAARANGMLRSNSNPIVKYAYEQGYTVCIARLKATRVATADHPKIDSIYNPALEQFINQFPKAGLYDDLRSNCSYYQRSLLGKKVEDISKLFCVKGLYKHEIDYLVDAVEGYSLKDHQAFNGIPDLFKKAVLKHTQDHEFLRILRTVERYENHQYRNPGLPEPTWDFITEDLH